MAKKKKTQGGIFEFTKIALGQKTYGKRQFKRDLRKLQKSGILSSRVDINLQAPTKYMLSQIRRFSAVLQGTAKTVPITRAEKEFYKKAGYPVKNKAAIIDVPKGARVKKLPTKNGIPEFRVTQKGQGGTRRSTRKLIPFEQMEQYITHDVLNAPPLGKGEYYGFRFYGNNSIRYFGNSGDRGADAKQRLLAYFLAYQSVGEAEQSDDPEIAGEIYRNFEVVKFDNIKEWDMGVNEQRARAKSARSAANRERYNAWRRHRYAQLDELEKREYNERRRESKDVAAARERDRRATIRRSEPEKYLAEKAASIVRARKSRARRKK